MNLRSEDTSKLAAADRVLAVLEAMPDNGARWFLEAYSNGREHGYSLHTGYNETKVAWSEYRNSDDIVVYVGKYMDFDMAGNVPSNGIYKAKRFFHYNEPDKAATYIVEALGMRKP